jgi:hypothetical protein
MGTINKREMMMVCLMILNRTVMNAIWFFHETSKDRIARAKLYDAIDCRLV